MLYGFLLTLFIITSVLLVMIILIQQSKSSMGLGNLGGGAQMLFGGSGGQDMFQKTTWVLGALFIFGSLGLSLLKTHYGRDLGYKTEQAAPMAGIETEQEPIAPVEPIE